MIRWLKCLFGSHDFKRPRKGQDKDWRHCCCGAKRQIRKRTKVVDIEKE